jgi:ATP-dependent DNA helicase RecQ
MDLPDNLEAYFQEAGRAGRDEKTAYAILLFDNSDIINLNNYFTLTYPELSLIQDIYQSLCNYYRIPVGNGEGLSFEFDNNDFSETYKQNPLTTFHALNFIEKAGLIVFTDPYSNASKVFIHCSREDLYRFQVENPYFDALIKLLLRSYAGLLTDFTRINENELAKRANIPVHKITEALLKMHELGILIYQQQTEKPRIIFLSNRLESKYIVLSESIYKERMEIAREKLNSVIQYTNNQTKCRSRQLLSYFGEEESVRCGKCDICLERNKIELSALDFDNVLKIIKPLLIKSDLSIEELMEKTHFSEEKTIKVIRWLLDNNKIIYTEEKKMRWHEL